MGLKSWMLAAALGLSLGSLQAQGTRVDFKGQPATEEAVQLAGWIGYSGDAAGKPFAIVDKRAARLYLFDHRHQLVGTTEVILGQTVGDHIVAGVGQRTQVGRVGRDERTTPAGRFEVIAGRNLSGEPVLWLDYESAFAIHRVRPGTGHADRLARLASPTPEDNRASLGCVVVPVDFYVEQVHRLLGPARGVVYVLPESSGMQHASQL